MPMSAYLRALRRRVGHDLLVLPAAAALIVDAQGRLLVVRQAESGRVGLPAGAIEPGESPDEAIRREVAEETGLDVEPTRLAGVFGPYRSGDPNGDRVEYTVTVQRCRIVGGRLDARDGEVAAFAWYAIDDLPDLGYPAALFAWTPGEPALFRFSAASRRRGPKGGAT